MHLYQNSFAKSTCWSVTHCHVLKPSLGCRPGLSLVWMQITVPYWYSQQGTLIWVRVTCLFTKPEDGSTTCSSFPNSPPVVLRTPALLVDYVCRICCIVLLWHTNHSLRLLTFHWHLSYAVAHSCQVLHLLVLLLELWRMDLYCVKCPCSLYSMCILVTSLRCETLLCRKSLP
jgi:hypothetical protein